MKKQLKATAVHMMHCNGKKEGKRGMNIFKNMIVVMAVFMGAALGAKGTAVRQPTAGQQPATTQPRTGVTQQVQPIYLSRDEQAARQQQSTTMSFADVEQNVIDALFAELMAPSVPWNRTIQGKYN